MEGPVFSFRPKRRADTPNEQSEADSQQGGGGGSGKPLTTSRRPSTTDTIHKPSNKPPGRASGNFQKDIIDLNSVLSTFHGSDTLPAAEKRALLADAAPIAAAVPKKVKRDDSKGNLVDRLHNAFTNQTPATPRPPPPPPEPLRSPAPTPSPYPGGPTSSKSVVSPSPLQDDVYKEYSVVLEQRRDQQLARFHSDLKSTGKAVRLLQQLVDPDGREAQADAGGQAGRGNAELRKLSERLRQIRGENSELQLAIDQAKRTELVPTKSSLQQYFTMSSQSSTLARKQTGFQRGTLGETQKSADGDSSPQEPKGESNPLGSRPSVRLQDFDTSLEFSRSLEEAGSIPMVAEEHTSDSGSDDDDDDEDEDEQDENGVFVYSRRKRKRNIKRFGVEKLSPERTRELLQPPSLAPAPTSPSLTRQAATLNDQDPTASPRKPPTGMKPNPLAVEFIEEIQHWISVCAVELEYWRTKLARTPSTNLSEYSPSVLEPEFSGSAEVMAGPFRIPLPPLLPGQDPNLQSKRQQEIIQQLDLESDLSKMALLTQLWVDHTEALQQQVYQTKAQLQKMQDAHQAYCLGVEPHEAKEKKKKTRSRNRPRADSDFDEGGSADDEDPIVVPRPSVIDDGGFFLPVVIPHAMPEGEDQWRHWRDQLLLESKSRGEPEVREEWVLELISRLDNQIRETIVHILATCTI